MLNATWGLGASIADGTVTPDTYVVRREDLSMLHLQIADKQVMTVMGQEGTREVPVPRFLRMRPALDDAQIQSVCQLALALEAEMGWPVDVFVNEKARRWIMKKRVTWVEKETKVIIRNRVNRSCDACHAGGGSAGAAAPADTDNFAGLVALAAMR
jgi:pyruvate,water dikinase